MDQNLDRVLNSMQLSLEIPTGQKEIYIDQLVQTHLSRSMSVAECVGVMQLCLSWACDGDEYLRRKGLSIFVLICVHNREAAKQFIQPECLMDLTNPGAHQNGVECLKFCMQALREAAVSPITRKEKRRLYDAVGNNITDFLRERGAQLEVFEVAIELLKEFPDCFPQNQPNDRMQFLMVVMECLGALPLPQTHQAAAFVKKVNPIAKFLASQMAPCDDVDKILDCLRIIYSSVCAKFSGETNDVAVTLAPLLDAIPDTAIPHAVQGILQNEKSVDAQIVAVMVTLCNWLIVWPHTVNLNKWILAMMKELGQQGRYELLSNIASIVVEKLFKGLMMPVFRKPAAPVVLHMLAEFQHVSSIFNKIAGLVPTVLQNLKQEAKKEKSVEELLANLVQLIRNLPALNTCSPHHRDPILQVLQDIPMKPDLPSKSSVSFDDPLVMWTAGPKVVVTSSPQVVSLPKTLVGLRSPDSEEKVGLDNLGNTCFINSVVQALFMTDEFRVTVLEAQPSFSETLLLRLQYLFAYLTFANRTTYSPVDFCTIACPSWFTPGRQQDCSEFLRFLLDTLQEQEKKSKEKESLSSSSGKSQSKQGKKTMMDSGEEDDDDEEEEGEDETEMEEDLGINDGEENSMDVTEKGDISSSSSNLSGKIPPNSGPPLRRWVTREDLTDSHSMEQGGSGVIPKDGGSEKVKEKAASQTRLNGSHSNSTDSGIQSVGESVEDGEVPQGMNGVVLSSKDSPPHLTPQTTTSSSQWVSTVQRIFGGQIATTYKCLTCGSESVHLDTLSDMHLAFPEAPTQKDSFSSSLATSTRGGYSLRRRPPKEESAGGCENGYKSAAGPFALEDLVDYYLGPEKLEGNNQYSCDRCGGLRDAERSLKITQPPHYLILTLMRFHYNKEANERCKVFTEVIYPEVLSLPVNFSPDSKFKDSLCPGTSKAKSGSKARSTSGGKREKYHIYAVVVHSGSSSESGHYYTCARHSDGNPDSWYTFNDHQVNRSSFQSLRSLAQHETPYVLFYRRASSAPPSPLCSWRIREEVRLAVERDNREHLEQLRREEQREQQHRKVGWGSTSSSQRYRWRDGDDDEDPPSTCGGGGGGLGGMGSSAGSLVC